MPSLLTTNPSNSVAKTSSANAVNNIGAAAPILQGLMEGQGWHDQRGEVLARDQEAALIVGRSRQAAAKYDAAPTAANRAELIAALADELADLEAQRDYAQAQQHEAKAQGNRKQGWGEWFKSFVIATPEQQAKEQAQKYAEVTAARQTRIDQLQSVLLQLTSESIQSLPELTMNLEEAEQVKSEEEVTEVLTNLSKKNRSADRQQPGSDDLASLPDPDVVLQHHGRRLLQSNSTAPGEFRVNTYTTNDQGYPSVSGLSNGEFVIAWQSYGQDGDVGGIYAQRYAANGTAQGAEFRVNTYTTGSQDSPSVSGLSNGEFVIAWTSYDYGQDGDGYGVYAQRYAANGTAQGAEFRVNTYTTGSQSSPSVSGLNNGEFVIAWQSSGLDQDGDGWGVYAQRYAANGMAQGVEFRVNTYTTNNQFGPSVSGLSNGEFVIAWTSYGQDGDGYGVYAQRYAANGTAQGMEFRVNTYTTNTQYRPSVSGFSNGEFVIAWGSNGQDGDGQGIYAQRYAANGTAQGVEFQVNTYTISSQDDPSVASLTSGEFVITWNSDGQDGDGYGVYAHLFSPPVFNNNRLTVSEGGSTIFTSNELSASDVDSSNSTLLFTISGLQHGIFQRVSNNSSLTQFTQQDIAGGEVRFVHDSSELAPVYSVSVGDGMFTTGPLAATISFTREFRVNRYTTDDQENPSVAGLTNGEFVIAWDSYGQDGDGEGVYAQRYAANGTAQGVEFRVNTYTTSAQWFPSVSGLTNGEFVIAWQSYGQDGDGEGIYAQRYAANGTAQGVEFRVNTYTTSHQESPSVSGLTNGEFVIAWESDAQDGDGWGVYAQRYAANGTAQGSEFRVNTYTASLQFSPSVASLSNGEFVIVWASNGQDGDGSGVYAQRYAANGTAQGTEFRVNTYTTVNQDSPSVGGFSNGEFVITWESNGQDGDGQGIYAQRYAANGTAQGAEFRVNTYTASTQYDPSVAALTNGEFVIAWQSYGQDGDGYGVYTQRYAANGTAQDVEFRVNTYTALHQYHSSVSGLSNGEFVIAWQSDGQDGDSYGVYAHLFSPPVFNNNRLTVSEGGSTIFSSNELSASGAFNSNFLFTISDLQHGIFNRVSNSTALTQFTQQDIAAGEVRFMHDGGELPPTYSVSVSDGQLTTGPFVPSPLNFTNINDAPVFINNRLTISEGGSIILTSNELSASDVDSSNSTLLFIISNLQQGVFQWVSNSSSLTQFRQQDIVNGQVYFAHDGGELAPAYNVSVSDGQLTTGPLSPAPLNFTNVDDAPVFINNRLTISEGGSTIFTSNELSAGDVDSNNSTLLFTISNLQHGIFNRVSNSTALTQFTQQDIAAGEVRFVHDGGELPPTYSVSVSDGQLTTGPFVPSPLNFTNINDAPVFINNRLTISEGGSIILTSNELSASDVDSSNSTLLFIISNLQQGVFQWVSNSSSLTQFRQQDIVNGQVYFAHDGGELPPAYNVSVSDGQLTTGLLAPFPLNFTNIDDAPVFINNRLAISEGGSIIFTSNELSASDIDSTNSSLLFAISNLQHGTFNRVSNNATLTQFTQQDVTDGEVRFVHTSDGLPVYNVSVSDGQLTTGPFAPTIDFLSNPKNSALPITLIAGGGVGGVVTLCLLYILYRYKNQQSKIGTPKAKSVSPESRIIQAVQEAEIELLSVDVPVPKVSIKGSVVDKAVDKAPAKSEADNVAIAIKPALPARPKAKSVPSVDPVSSLSSQANVQPDGIDSISMIASASLVSSNLPSFADSKHEVSDELTKSSSRSAHGEAEEWGLEPLSPTSPRPLEKTGELKLSFNIPYEELEYNEKDKLGSGSYGTVYKGTYQFSNVAIKKLHAEHFSQTALAELRQEAGIMGSMRSDFIVQLRGVCMEAPNFCLVMELMPKGSLYSLLRNAPDLPMSVVYRIGMDVGYGLHLLHKDGILHRDLKSLNVLLDDRLRAKISDFGLSKIKSEMGSMSSTQGLKGTAGWMAPEQFGEGESAKASQASDIYSYGMVLWEMLNKPYRIPFKGIDSRVLGSVKAKRGAEQETIPDNCPAPLKELVMSCWQPEAKQRPSAQAVAKSLGQLFSALSNESAPRSVAKVEVLEQTPEAQSEIPGYLSNIHSGQPAAGIASHPVVSNKPAAVEPTAQSEVPGYLSNTRSS